MQECGKDSSDKRRPRTSRAAVAVLLVDVVDVVDVEDGMFCSWLGQLGVGDEIEK